MKLSEFIALVIFAAIAWFGVIQPAIASDPAPVVQQPPQVIYVQPEQPAAQPVVPVNVIPTPMIVYIAPPVVDTPLPTMTAVPLGGFPAPTSEQTGNIGVHDPGRP